VASDWSRLVCMPSNSNREGCAMSYDILKELKLYFDDHYENFNCYPVEFEFNKTVFNYDECVKLLDSVGYLWRGDA